MCYESCPRGDGENAQFNGALPSLKELFGLVCGCGCNSPVTNCETCKPTDIAELFSRGDILSPRARYLMAVNGASGRKMERVKSAVCALSIGTSVDADFQNMGCYRTYNLAGSAWEHEIGGD